MKISVLPILVVLALCVLAVLGSPSEESRERRSPGGGCFGLACFGGKGKPSGGKSGRPAGVTKHIANNIRRPNGGK